MPKCDWGEGRLWATPWPALAPPGPGRPPQRRSADRSSRSAEGRGKSTEKTADCAWWLKNNCLSQKKQEKNVGKRQSNIYQGCIHLRCFPAHRFWTFETRNKNLCKIHCCSFVSCVYLPFLVSFLRVDVALTVYLITNLLILRMPIFRCKYNNLKQRLVKYVVARKNLG